MKEPQLYGLNNVTSFAQRFKHLKNKQFEQGTWVHIKGPQTKAIFALFQQHTVVFSITPLC